LRSHSVNRLLTAEIIQRFSRGNPTKSALQPVCARLSKQSTAQDYSRAQKIDANEAAHCIIRVTGYDPPIARRLCRRHQSRTADPDSLAAYFSSHPPFSARIARIEKLTAQNPSLT